mgnify:FL=1|jgi:CMP-N,N'-diacetyllegionaminic acid synthase
MIDNKRILAIIPARGGSKRLPRKNILNLAGKPLIAWSIESALASKYIDRVIVSSDDDEIAAISEKYGADVPFMRPADLATDESTSIDVVLYTIEALRGIDEQYDYVILLQPTSPLRQAKHIDDSISQMINKGSDAIISVCESEHHPLWNNTLDSDMSMDNFLEASIRNKRSQDLEKQYRINGSIYISSIEKLKKENSFFLRKNCSAYIMNQDVSIDIDKKIDLDLASLILK